ncbi:MAG: glycosyltransferase [Methyloprofundus sp.]|nr:glycosyltransferase [Methyloprofundus sp.]
MKDLTVIIPIRSLQNRNITERLPYCVSDPFLDRSQIDFLIVDDGSPLPECQRHKAVCEQFNLKYHYIESYSKSANMARARNAGVELAQTKYIMFMDVDLFPPSGYYNDILHEIKIQKLDENPDDLIMTAVIYLSQKQGIERFFSTPPNSRKSLFLAYCTEQENPFIEKVSTGTSVALMHRLRYLELGGYDESFEQWGYEDLDFNLRMMYHSDKFPLPKDFTKDIMSFSDIDTYRGWKSMYKLYGDITFQKGIVLFHIWHDVDQKSPYSMGYAKNRQRFVNNIANLANEARPAKCRITKKDPLFEQYANNDRPLTLTEYYQNSPLIIWLLSVKSTPLFRSFLLIVKRALMRQKN